MQNFHFLLSYIGEGNGNTLQCSCLENPWDGGAWWAAVSGVSQSRTRRKRLSLECKSQEIPGVTGTFGLRVQNEEGQTLIEFCQEKALVIENTLFQQHKRTLYTGTSPGGQCQNQIDYILFSQRWRSPIQSAKTRPGADCGSDHSLLIAKFRLKLKKVEKTTSPFRYDLNQILYNYTVEVTNRF